MGNRASWKSAVFKAGMSAEGARQARRVEGLTGGTWTKQDPGKKTAFPEEWDPVGMQLMIWFLRKNMGPRLTFWKNTTSLGEGAHTQGRTVQRQAAIRAATEAAAGTAEVE